MISPLPCTYSPDPTSVWRSLPCTYSSNPASMWRSAGEEGDRAEGERGRTDRDVWWHGADRTGPVELRHDYWSKNHTGHLLQPLFLYSRPQWPLCHGHPEQHFLHTHLCDPGFTGQHWLWNWDCIRKPMSVTEFSKHGPATFVRSLGTWG